MVFQIIFVRTPANSAIAGPHHWGINGRTPKQHVPRRNVAGRQAHNVTVGRSGALRCPDELLSIHEEARASCVRGAHV